MSKKYLYVIKSNSGLIKVGVSQNAEVRENQIRTGSGHETELLYIAGPFNAATKLEGRIHRRLGDSRQFGEWFSCTESQAVSEAKQLADSFVDEPDIDESISKEIREKLIAELFTNPANKAKESFNASMELLISKYQESVDLNESLSSQFVESCELLDWYGNELKNALFLAGKAMDQVKRLELQIQKLKEKPPEEATA